MPVSGGLPVLGYFVTHPTLKIGQVVQADFSVFSVHFFIDGAKRQFEKSAFTDGDLSRIYLPPGTRCRTSDRGCRIDQVLEQIRYERPVVYLVTTDDGLQLQLKESDLVPAAIVREDPVTSLTTLQQEGLTLFASRSELVDAVAEVVRQGGGLTALLSSRIDVRPHQAYVAGVVLQDRLRRYILADEVGLGKTIEAGIVVQDLLTTRPTAKVLVLCPGALTQQWLCEFYTKFSNRVFTLLDLHTTPDRLSPHQRRTVIAPLHAINGPHRTWLKDILSPVVQIPVELEKLFVVIEHELPGREQLLEIAAGIATEEGELPNGPELDTLLDAASGLIRHLFRWRKWQYARKLVRDPEGVNVLFESLCCAPKSGCAAVETGY